MIDRMRAAASHINEMHTRMIDSAQALRSSSSNSVFSEAKEQQLTIPVSSGKLDCRVCAVDGGLLAQEMHGIDLLIGRAVTVGFTYTNSVLSKSACFPSAFPEPDYDVKIGLDEHEIQLYRTLFRLDLEISAAISALENLKPDVLLLDGSIVPLSTDRPAEDNELFGFYTGLISKYAQLYNLCKKNGTLLTGITKDSRGRRFMDIVKDKVPHRWSDTSFLNHVLKEKERTFAMKYSGSPSKHAVLKDLEGYADSICIFYLKCSSEDRPMRVEFLNSDKHSVSEIASLVYTLSAINKSYAYPAVLIEADLRAAMDPLEMERAQKSLMSLSNFVQPLRRNSRPFR